MRELDRGEDFIVTRNGVPVAELRPIAPRQFVSRDVVAKAFAGAPAIDLEEFPLRSEPAGVARFLSGACSTPPS
jgi:antitoxin (DNA-binding transcriptional repressor) of toxin-antitoxin stability system